jgi:hypothetical protein
MDKVFGDWFGVRASSKLSDTHAVGEKALVSTYPILMHINSFFYSSIVVNCA